MSDQKMAKGIPIIEAATWAVNVAMPLLKAIAEGELEQVIERANLALDELLKEDHSQ